MLRLIAVIDRIVENQAQIPPIDQHRDSPSGTENGGRNNRPTGHTIEARRTILLGQAAHGFIHTGNLVATTISPMKRERMVAVRSRLTGEPSQPRTK